MTAFPHRAIAASAGTGKTWALTHRYLALMTAGVSPDRICALTFSRKAAGEIFDAVVGRLCLCAGDATERTLTAHAIARQASGLTPPEDPRAYVALLRRLLDQMHRLRVGTLDSFIFGVVRAFPLELGLPPDVQPMDNEGADARRLRQALLMRLFDPGWRERDTATASAGADLLQAVRQANFGREMKSLINQVDDKVVESRDFYREHTGKAWGDAALIWPTGRWWEAVDRDALQTARDNAFLDALCQAFGERGDPSQLGRTCATVVAAAAAHAPDRPWPQRLSATVTPQLIEIARQTGGEAVITYKRKEYALPPALRPPLRAAMANLIQVDVRRSSTVTAGLRDLLARYDAHYVEAQRRAGTLSFDDFARQLGADGQRPSLNPATIDRLYIDYRLDSRLDHWLLDEFQDTSDTQWHAIANLVDEVVQDPEQRRSFFYVGDIKQSIYGWRGGNYRLFGHVRERCGIPAGDTLTICHRSVPAVIETVNAVFDDLAGWTPRAGCAAGPHPAAVDAFSQAWEQHVAARDGAGYAALLEYTPVTGGVTDDDDADDIEDAAQYRAVADVLASLQPIERNLSAAVLVRSNRQGRECVNVLRRRLGDVPVVHEGTGGIVDNPVVTLLLALVRYAAHPGDTLARRHLQMSPWAAARGGARESWLADLPGRFMASVHAGGFAGALRPWGAELLDAHGPAADDPFGRQRLREFLAAAEAYDQAGSRDADAFDDAIRAHQVKADAATGAIRVMTIHQCKGLGFDIVLAPFHPADRSFADTRGIDLLRSDIGEALPLRDGWVLATPGNAVLTATGGPPLQALETARAQQNFSQLCVLYVAMTRAKRGLYLFTPTPPKSPVSVRCADLVRERLATANGPLAAQWRDLALLYETGDADWYRHGAERTADPPAAEPEPPPWMMPFTDAVVRCEPSKDRPAGRPFPAAYLFKPEAGDARHFGSAIHRLFERIPWLEDVDIDALIAEWRATAGEPPDLLDNVETQFRQCLATPEVRSLLMRPAHAARAEVWLETPFDYVRQTGTQREIMTGRFDRLLIERDAADVALRAMVVDFKSNRLPDAEAMLDVAEGYRQQMDDYAAAAARLLGLPDTAVDRVLLFTRMAKTLPLSVNDT